VAADFMVAVVEAAGDIRNRSLVPFP